MKKIFASLLFVVLVLSGLGAGVQATSMNETCDMIIHHLSEPQIITTGEFLQIDVFEAKTQLLREGKPILPVFVYTYQYPLGTLIKNVDVSIDTDSYTLSKKILPTPAIHTYSILSKEMANIHSDVAIYEQTEPYPSQAFTISDTCGLSNEERYRTISIHVYPQYYPALNLVTIPNTITISIDYLPPAHPVISRGEYDLLIITDESFVSALEPLVDHKTQMGIKTIIDTTQNIYPSYDGRDDAEDIKLRIKDAIEEWNIQYVLLAGGRKGQSFDWYVPERRTNNDDGWEGGYASDLYFGDIYKIEENETVFEDWDSNGNGIFAEWGGITGPRDYIDYHPDVYVGRLPFRYVFEVKPMVDKIIIYETSTVDSWFKTGLAIGGDTGPPCRGPATPGIYEGEVSTGMSASLLESVGFTMDRLFLSDGDWDGRDDIVNAISQGCGFIDMAGHGNPSYWGNFLPDAQSEDEMIDGLLLRDMPKLSNKEKIPFVVVGGCHNAQFNVTMMNIIKGIQEYGIRGMFFEPPFRFYFNEWVPRSFCTGMVFARRGGAIGSIGCTGLGLGYFNVIGLSDWLNVRFFDAYANQTKEILGEAHGTALQDYITIQGGVNSNQGDRKTVEEWALIGDPSLKLGGY
jgi:hypothetical protein